MHPPNQHRVVRVADVPALEGRADPTWWGEWSRDSDYGPGWHSINTHLGITGFGINGATADAGKELIVPHVESDYTPQEEVYLVVEGRARFTCDGETIELSPGELLLVGADVNREARALATPTTVIALGGAPGAFKTWEKPAGQAPER
jgi:mannose-6-phosphate isomerase-like protein (cupin superfamily)